MMNFSQTNHDTKKAGDHSFGKLQSISNNNSPRHKNNPLNRFKLPKPLFKADLLKEPKSLMIGGG